MKNIRIPIIIIRIALGGLFIYGGVKKFVPKTPQEAVQQHHQQKAQHEPAQHDDAYHEQTPQEKTCATQARDKEKIKAYIGGLKQTGYFWPMLGLVELLCGLLLLTQRYALLGAVMLVPITLNIFLLHVFLEAHEVGELFTTALYFLANLGLMAYDYPGLKAAFLDKG